MNYQEFARLYSYSRISRYLKASKGNKKKAQQMYLLRAKAVIIDWRTEVGIILIVVIITDQFQSITKRFCSMVLPSPPTISSCSLYQVSTGTCDTQVPVPVTSDKTSRLTPIKPNSKLSIPPMPTPYGVSWQTISLGVNWETNFWRRSEVYKKAVTP